jgi:VanZ family protein
MIPPLALMFLIMVLSSIPMDGSARNLKFLTDLNPTVQNLFHIPLFGLLGYLWLNSLSMIISSYIFCISSAFLICVSFGIADEIYQTFIPGRFGGLQDILLNLLGVTLAIVVFTLQKRVKPSKP